MGVQKIKSYYIDDPIYGQGFCLLYGKGLDDYLLKQFNISEATSGERGLNTGSCFSLEKPGSRLSFVWVRTKDTGRLAHECLHRAINNLKFCGVKLDPENDEPLTYYFEYIFKQCLKALK